MKHPLKFIATTVCLLFAAATSSHAVVWLSYHDLGAATGFQSTGNITTHQIGASDISSGALDTSQKALINFSDGTTTGVLFSIDRANGVDTRNGGEYAPPAAATPAGDLFLVPGLDLSNGAIFTQNAVMTLTFTGLDPNLLYNVALYGNRLLSQDGVERFTLGGVDAATNTSSFGIISPLVTDAHTRVSVDQNLSNPNFVGWSDIRPGADGSFTISVDPRITSTSNLAYLTAIRLEATPEPSKAMLLAIGLLGLLVRRRR